MIPIGWNMLTESSTYVGFVDGASFHTKNLSSVSWVMYAPEVQLASSSGVCLQPSSKNLVEYSAVIKVLWDVISNGIWYLKVHLDSQLTVHN